MVIANPYSIYNQVNRGRLETVGVINANRGLNRGLSKIRRKINADINEQKLIRQG